MKKYFIALRALILFSALNGATLVSAESGFSLPRPYKQNDQKLRVAIFAGGCFWCMEPPFEKLRGVKAVISGYAGGKEKNPTYDNVSYGRTTHVESVLVLYDPRQVSYRELLQVFWRNINPEQGDGQFYDRGEQYKTYIFYANAAEQSEAEKSKMDLLRSGKFAQIATGIRPATEFWPAEDYHQDYYKKNPGHYYRYRKGSGRDDYLRAKWGNP